MAAADAQVMNIVQIQIADYEGDHLEWLGPERHDAARNNVDGGEAAAWL